MNDSKAKKLRVTGWVISIMLTLFLIGGSAMGKFSDWEGKAEMFASMGWDIDVMFKIGILEVAIALLFLVPRTAFIAAILLAAYLGGATATHVRVGEPIYMPVLLGVIAWVALGLRHPAIFRLMFQSNARVEA